MTEFIHKVTKEDEGMEVREIMRTYFDFSARLRNKIKREKLVMLNDEQTPGWIKPEVGDVIRIDLPEEKSHFEPQPIPLDPVYEDDDLLIINKQPGSIRPKVIPQAPWPMLLCITWNIREIPSKSASSTASTWTLPVFSS